MNAKLTIAALAVTAPLASAQVFHWDWNAGDNAVNNSAGTFDNIRARFDPATGRTTWRLTFADQITDGFTLAVSPGPNPKGHSGEMALVYFDASTLGAPKMTIYNYNGVNSASSYYDGSNAAGNQTPDIIYSATESPAITSDAWAYDTPAGKRVLGFRIGATPVNEHTPMYPGDTPWTGMAFGDHIGVWLHPFTNLNAQYDNAGALTHWSGQQGWLDGSNFETTSVPVPGAVTLAALGGVVALRRKRK